MNACGAPHRNPPRGGHCRPRHSSSQPWCAPNTCAVVSINSNQEALAIAKKRPRAIRRPHAIHGDWTRRPTRTSRRPALRSRRLCGGLRCARHRSDDALSLGDVSPGALGHLSRRDSQSRRDYRSPARRFPHTGVSISRDDRRRLPAEVSVAHRSPRLRCSARRGASRAGAKSALFTGHLRGARISFTETSSVTTISSLAPTKIRLRNCIT